MDGVNVQVCAFAKSLRMTLWAEHLGLDDASAIDDPNAGLAEWPDPFTSDPAAPNARHHAVVHHPMMPQSDITQLMARLAPIIAAARLLPLPLPLARDPLTQPDESGNHVRGVANGGPPRERKNVYRQTMREPSISNTNSAHGQRRDLARDALPSSTVTFHLSLEGRLGKNIMQLNRNPGRPRRKLARAGPRNECAHGLNWNELRATAGQIR